MVGLNQGTEEHPPGAAMKAAPTGESAIRIEGLRKRYGDAEAVSGLDLVIPYGQFVGLLGPNGSGKTTTMHALATLVRPTSGHVAVGGRDVLRDPVGVRRNIGLVFQESALDRNLTIRENLDFSAALYDLAPDQANPRIEELLTLFGLEGKRDVQVGALSGGMRRALDIIRGILHRPGILLLDEPTIGLDVLNRRFIWRYLDRLRREEGMTVLLTTHYLEEAEDCDHVTFIRDGRTIGAGSPEEMLERFGAFVMEVRGGDPEATAAITERLGNPIIEGDRHLFRLMDPHQSIGDLEEWARPHVQSLLVRRPDLNDVYIWLNQDPTGGEAP
ncbi:ABC transporter ATP-binding protein [Thiohalorhabdus sp. Cl-TMA]|uniref:ABC transporter ATP-binding protein n=1 Tax=Thiohalorhabdus methylotrophus TaxID=3242694 RepID=A0ABV4TWW7_9GAMM